MTTLYYSRDKLIFSGPFLLFGAPMLGLLCMFGGPIMMLIGVLLLVSGPLLSVGRIGRALGDLKAVEYDERQITLHALGRTRKLNWREVTAIEVQTLTQSVLGVIPVDRQHSIRISHSGGMVGTARILIPFNVLADDKATVVARLADMERLRSGRGQPLPRTAPPALDDEAEPSDFDADAVMARYLAQREAEAQADAAAAPRMPPRVAGFGRKRA